MGAATQGHASLERLCRTHSTPPRAHHLLLSPEFSSLVLAEAHDVRRPMVVSVHVQGGGVVFVHLDRGEFDQAESLTRRALTIFRKGGSMKKESYGLNRLGKIASERGD